jgi:hypothetical protein
VCATVGITGRATATTPCQAPIGAVQELRLRNTGLWIHNTGAGWLMTSLAPSPVIVSLVQAASMLPVKTPITAAGILNDRVVPFYDEHGIRLSRMLTDRGTEFCGSDSHEYELYLAVEDIDHTRTKAKSPQTNGICQRFHRTVLDEFYRVAFRKNIYRTIDELQADLDAWMTEYNERRPHQGRWCFGKTPMQTFLGKH